MKDLRVHRVITIALFAAYLIPRIAQYLFNRSFWWDEAALAINVINRSYGGLIHQPFEFAQSAPIGFLLVSKFISNHFGYNEYAFRLFPLICSIAALYLFYLISKLLLEPAPRLISIGLFAISVPLIRYASEFKQYTTDMVSALSIFLIGVTLNTRIKTGTNSKNLYILFFLIGIILLFFSYPSVFVLAVIGIWLLINMIIQKKWKAVTILMAFYILWLIVFIILYIYILDPTANNDYYKKFFRSSSTYWGSPELGSFLPIPVSKTTAILFLKWIKKNYIEFFSMPGGFRFDQIAACFFIIGCIVFLEKEKNIGFAIVSIFILPLLISAIELFPFYQRFVIFLAPFIYIFVANAVYLISKRVSDQLWGKKILLVILIGMLSLQSVEAGKLFVKKQETLVEIKPALQYVLSEKKPEDIIFVPYALSPVIQYYSRLFKINENSIKIGKGSVFDENLHDNRPLYEKDIFAQLNNPGTVWVVLTYIPQFEKEMFLEILNQIGDGKIAYNYGNVQIYKYIL